jgi:hypothetical protein
LSLYLPLSHDDNASPAELNAAWLQNPFGYGNVVAYLQGLSTQYGKPIMLLESGFQSVQGGFEQHFTDGTHPVDNGVQAAGIASMLDVLGKYQGDWFKGLSIWSVFPPFMDLASAQNQWGYTTGFMTNGKPAAQTIADYFTGATTYSNPDFYGGIASGTIHGSYAADTIHAGVGAEIIFAGAGNDTILFSAGSPVPSAAHIVIQASGDVHDATGAKFQLYVDGRALGGVNEAKASQPFTFDLPLSSLSAVHTFSIVTVPDPLFANGINRAVHVSKIEVNAYALSQSDGNYEGGQIVGAGSWNQLYSGTTMVQPFRRTRTISSDRLSTTTSSTAARASTPSSSATRAITTRWAFQATRSWCRPMAKARGCRTWSDCSSVTRRWRSTSTATPGKLQDFWESSSGRTRSPIRPMSASVFNWPMREWAMRSWQGWRCKSGWAQALATSRR